VGQAAITEEQVEHFPDLSFKWLLDASGNLQGLIQIARPDIVERMNFALAQKLPESYITDVLREQRTDVTYLVPCQGRRKEFPLCIHIEHQSKPDSTMSYRMSLYAHLIWDKQRQEWKEKGTKKEDRKFYTILPIVFYTGRKTWKRLRPLKEVIQPQEPFGDFAPQYETVFKSLLAIPDEELVVNDNPFGWAMRLLKKVQIPKEEFITELEEAVSCISRVANDYQWGKLTQYLVLLVRHRRKRAEVEELVSFIETLTTRSERKKEVREMAMTSAQALKREGAIETRREDILKAIQSRFQNVPSALSKRIETIKSMPRLKRIFEQCLTVDSIDEIEI